MHGCCSILQLFQHEAWPAAHRATSIKSKCVFTATHDRWRRPRRRQQQPLPLALLRGLVGPLCESAGTEVSALIFGGTQDWDQGDHLKNAADRAGLLLSELEAAIEGGDQLTEVAENQRALAAVGHWGVPTMVVREEPFFGQDRIKTLCWRLDQYGLARSG